MPYALGVDLGSGRVTAAISRNDRGRWLPTEVVALDGEPAGAVSALHVTDQDTVEVGGRALLALPARAGSVARGVMDRIGDAVPVILDGRPYPPEVLTAAMVGWVVDYVEATEGMPASHLAVTHPPAWGPYRRGLLSAALREVSLPELTLLPRPVAAAESHAAVEPVEVGEEIAVHSLGTGRFEAAVLRRGSFGFELRAHADSAEDVGGALFDDLLAEHVLAALPGDRPDGAGLAALRAECAVAKERLSTETSVTVPPSVTVGREELEELVRPAVESTVRTLRRTIEAAGGDAPRVVVLVGGCGRMPVVAELVAAGLRTRVLPAPEPETAIARGAAIAAARSAKPTVQAEALAVAPDALVPRSAVTHTDLMRLDDLPVEDLTELGPPPPRPPVDIPPLEPPKRRLLPLGGGRSSRTRDDDPDGDEDDRNDDRNDDREFDDLEVSPRRRSRRQEEAGARPPDSSREDDDRRGTAGPPYADPPARPSRGRRAGRPMPEPEWPDDDGATPHPRAERPRPAAPDPTRGGTRRPAARSPYPGDPDPTEDRGAGRAADRLRGVRPSRSDAPDVPGPTQAAAPRRGIHAPHPGNPDTTDEPRPTRAANRRQGVRRDGSDPAEARDRTGPQRRRDRPASNAAWPTDPRSPDDGPDSSASRGPAHLVDAADDIPPGRSSTGSAHAQHPHADHPGSAIPWPTDPNPADHGSSPGRPSARRRSHHLAEAADDSADAVDAAGPRTRHRQADQHPADDGPRSGSPSPRHPSHQLPDSTAWPADPDSGEDDRPVTRRGGHHLAEDGPAAIGTPHRQADREPGNQPPWPADPAPPDLDPTRSADHHPAHDSRRPTGADHVPAAGRRAAHQLAGDTDDPAQSPPSGIRRPDSPESSPARPTPGRRRAPDPTPGRHGLREENPAPVPTDDPGRRPGRRRHHALDPDEPDERLEPVRRRGDREGGRQ